jgi:nucleoside-diphosphate-sugar epimerase
MPISPAPRNETELEELLSRPDAGAVQALTEHRGDILVLGAGGKMGPSLSRMARRAADQADQGRPPRRVIAVSRFSTGATRELLESAAVDTIAVDLTDVSAISALPDAPNVIFMAGQKFGTRDAPSATWAANAAVPALVATRFTTARMVVFSTGNVYPLTPSTGTGAKETDPPAPIGEYASSCLGRERIFEHYAALHGQPLAILRLNYANDLRYGVLVDIALAVMHEQPIDLRMGHVNVIWQGDANARAIAALSRAATPPFIVNITGDRTLRVRDVAARFGKLLKRTPIFAGEEAPDALLSDVTLMTSTFGAPVMPADWMVAAVAEWITHGGTILGKPTSFQTRDGRF